MKRRADAMKRPSLLIDEPFGIVWILGLTTTIFYSDEKAAQ